MKIFIADDSDISLKNISKILESRPKFELVGIAKNSQEGLKQLEKLQPDLLLINWEHEGIAQSKAIKNKHPKLKIVLLVAEPKFALAIKSGADGVVTRETAEKDFLAAIEAVGRGSKVFLGQPDSSEQIIKQFPFLKSWNNLLAAEIVNFWANNQEFQIDWINSLKSLGITLKADNLPEFSQEIEYRFEFINSIKQGSSPSLDLCKELSSRKEYLFNKLPVSLNSLNYIEEEIRKWYTGDESSDGYSTVPNALKKKAPILMVELDEKLQNLIQSFWSKTSIKESLAYLRELEIFLFDLKGQYEDKKQESSLNERECLRIYNERVSVISSSQDGKTEKHYRIAKNALYHLYVAKLQGEIYSSAERALAKMMETNQSYLSDLNQAYSFLMRIRQNLLTDVKTNVHTLLPLIYEQFSNYLNLSDLKKEVEQEIGRSMYKWGVNRTISEQEVQNLLLEKLAPVTQKIYEKIKQEFERESITNKHLEQLSPGREAC